MLSEMLKEILNRWNNEIIVRYNDRLISLRTLSTLVTMYEFMKIFNSFNSSTSEKKTFKLYNGPTITLIYR